MGNEFIRCLFAPSACRKSGYLPDALGAATYEVIMKFQNKDIVELDEENLKRYQSELLAMASDITRVFDENFINYSLSGGSILGAVRHKGFIPWDDDIDMNIPREDFERLIEIFDRTLGDKYYIQTPENSPSLGILVTQIRKRGTVARRKYDWDLDSDQCGISIDLYIIENVFDDPIRRFFQKNISMLLSFAVASIRTYNNRDLPQELKRLEGRKLNYPRGKMIAGRILRLLPLDMWISWAIFWFSLCKDNTSRLVAIPTGRKHFAGEIYKRKYMCVFKKVRFESERFNVPIWAKGYLKRFYGDYMQLPPEDKRERHLFLELKY